MDIENQPSHKHTLLTHALYDLYIHINAGVMTRRI